MRIQFRPPGGLRHPIARPILMVSSAAVGAAYGTLGGSILAKTYGPRLLADSVPHALKLVNQGVVGADTALCALYWAAQPANQAFAGALSLGLVGAVSGAALAYAVLS